MKVRMGFVSNSSTSSFCCYGAAFETAELENLLKIEDKDLYEVIEDKCSKLGLNYYSLEEYEEGWVVGLDYMRMEQDETRAQFEKRAADLVQQFVGSEVECDLQEGTYPS